MKNQEQELAILDISWYSTYYFKLPIDTNLMICKDGVIKSLEEYLSETELCVFVEKGASTVHGFHKATESVRVKIYSTDLKYLFMKEYTPDFENKKVCPNLLFSKEMDKKTIDEVLEKFTISNNDEKNEHLYDFICIDELNIKDILFS